MKRQRCIIHWIMLLATLTAEVGCGKGGPTGPSSSIPERPAGPTYTISGVIAEYHGGPLSGVRVEWLGCSLYWGILCQTQTDQQGHYRTADIAVGKDGYQFAVKTNLSAQNPSADFVLHPAIAPLNVHDGTLAGTVQGDEIISGDDSLFGGMCAHTACKVIMIAEFSGPPIPVEVRLRGPDAKHQLALYHAVYTENLHAVPPATRHCCASELVVTLNVSGYFDAFAVAFEQSGGGPPSPADSQSFELTARAMR